jgi:hypothetical protein
VQVDGMIVPQAARESVVSLHRELGDAAALIQK